MSFDAVRLAMRHAAERHGSADTFNAANFSQSIVEVAGMSGPQIDGKLVEAILCGRGDVEQLAGGAHYRLIETNPDEVRG